MNPTIPTIDDVRNAAETIYQHLSPAPLIRSPRLEKELGLPESRRVWIKDYGWTPVGSFKLLGALNWMAANLEAAGDRYILRTVGNDLGLSEHPAGREEQGN